MDKTDLGDRMKQYESLYSGRFMSMLPIIARIDGKTFSNFTRGLRKPYDSRLSNLMIETTHFLLMRSSATIGYTQSDEISLVWPNNSIHSDMFFGGKINKINSVLASMCTEHFNKHLYDYIEEEIKYTALFDCRSFQVPTLIEAANYLKWRERDAIKNSISAAARMFYSHNELFKKNSKQMQQMLWETGVNWNDYPTYFKRGTFLKREMVNQHFTAEEISRLPPKHDARKNPEFKIRRSKILEFNDSICDNMFYAKEKGGELCVAN